MIFYNNIYIYSNYEYILLSIILQLNIGNSMENNKCTNVVNSNSDLNNSNKINYPNKINNSGNLINPKPNIEKANKVNKVNKENKVKKANKANKVKNIDNDIIININNDNKNNNFTNKLDKKPNSIKTFEENLIRKKEEDEKIRKEKKIKNDFENKKNNYTLNNYILNNDNQFIKDENNIIRNIPKLDLENNQKDNYVDKTINSNNNLDNNLDKNSDNNLDNYSDDNLDDDEKVIREPLPTKTDCLLGFENINDEFFKFKKQILSDISIDKDMKQIIIQSRMEFIKNHEQKLQKNTEKIIRAGLIAPLKIKLKDINFTKISLKNIEKIILLIDKWVDMKIELIELEPDLLYQLYELVDLMEDKKIIHDTQKIKNIFNSSNPDEFIELVEMMEIVKTQSILEEKNRIERELKVKKIEEENYAKQQQLEKIKLQEIEFRNEKVKLLLFNLNKMAGFDSGIKNLKDLLNEPIKKYCNIDTEFVILNENLYNNTIKFINSIRISLQDRESIIKICKCL